MCSTVVYMYILMSYTTSDIYKLKFYFRTWEELITSIVFNITKKTKKRLHNTADTSKPNDKEIICL